MKRGRDSLDILPDPEALKRRLVAAERDVARLRILIQAATAIQQIAPDGKDLGESNRGGSTVLQEVARA